jgi:Glycosyl transferases group 1
MIRILFIGETWQGSNARSLREALAERATVAMHDIGVDTFLPIYDGLPLRLANRVLRGLQRRELRHAVRRTLETSRPDAIVVYKGMGIDATLVAEMRAQGTPVINVFPDYSPHAYGRELQEAMAEYDLIISTKPFHPKLWRTKYGYRNHCVCVPHGYDPAVHYWPAAPTSQIYDVALCGTWRPEYHRLMRAFAAALDDDRVSVAVAGSGWFGHRGDLPKHWHYVGTRLARSYGEFLRSARVAIAPVNRDVIVRGVEQPGDEDTTRTYELAAARCFFVHQRTTYVQSVFDEQTEVPLWSDPQELANLVRRWLPDHAGRRDMASRAQARAVPAYSISQRALSVLRHIEALIETRAVVSA